MALTVEFVVQKKGEKKKITIKEEAFAFVIRDPFLLSFFLSIFLSYSFSLSLLKLAPCAQQQTMTTIVKGTNEGVH
jgi:hypothetical protein